jgi:O-antigen ligase
MVASVVAGASRAGSILVIAEVVVGMLLALSQGLDRRTVAWGAAQFAVLALVFTAVVGWDFLWLRFQEADPYAFRREMLVSSIQMIREKPSLGFGLGTWSTVYPAHALVDDGTFANQAHNDWAQWAVEGGLPLAAVMLLFAAMLLRPAYRSLWGLGLISVLLHCLVDYPMQQRPPLAGFFFALAGVLVAFRPTPQDFVIQPYPITRHTPV